VGENAAHREARRRGREEFFDWYRVWVSGIVREYSYGDPPPELSWGPEQAERIAGACARVSRSSERHHERRVLQ
jgi:hypothetical protein